MPMPPAPAPAPAPAPEPQPRRTLTSPRLWLGALLLAASAGLWSWGDPWLSLEALRRHQQGWAICQATHPWTARFGFAAIDVLVTALLLPGATALTLAGGVLLGWAEGAIMMLLAADLGATLAMMMARWCCAIWRAATPGAGIQRWSAAWPATATLTC